MSRSRYARVEGNLPPLTRIAESCYNETSILNNTSRPIFMVDFQNNVTRLAPQPIIYGHEELLIYDRGIVGATMGKHNNQLSLPGCSYRISPIELTEEPIYVKELNALFCIEESIGYVKHPFSGAQYSAAMDTAVHIIAQQHSNNELPSVVISANDPNGRTDLIFASIDGRLIEIPVDNIPGEDAFVVVQYLHKNSNFQIKIPLEELFTSEDGYIELANVLFPFITLDRKTCLRLIANYHPITDKQFKAMEKDCAERIQALTQEHKRLIDSVKAESASKISTLTLDIERIAQEKAKLSLELVEVQERHRATQGVLTANNELVGVRYKEKELAHRDRELGYKEDTAAIKKEQSELEHKEAMMKLITTGLTLVVGGVGWKVLTWLYEQANKNNAAHGLVKNDLSTMASRLPITGASCLRLLSLPK